MRLLYYTIAFVCLVNVCLAQDYYSYISDRKFKSPANLIGYNFKPASMEVPGESKQDLSPGSYAFGISRNNLYVEGEGVKGVYSVNNINPTEYGFKLLLMNARNPMIQGHLKIILNERAQAEALIFKRSTRDIETIFFLPEVNERLDKKEGDYFTNLRGQMVEHIDSLWGMNVQPFLVIHHDVNIQNRLQIADSTAISFVEKITIIEKKKRKRKKKKKKKETVEIDSAAIALLDTVPVLDSLALADSLQNEEKKIKIIKTYFVTLRTPVYYDDGTSELETQEYEIKSVVEKEATDSNEKEPYRITFKQKKGDPVFLYLTAERTVSSIEIGPSTYYMRGH